MVLIRVVLAWEEVYDLSPPRHNLNILEDLFQVICVYSANLCLSLF